MRAMFVVGSLLALGMAGCATSNGFAVVPSQDAPSVRVGEARVLDPGVNPLVPVHVTSYGDAIEVRMAHAGRVGALMRLDAASLETLSRQEHVAVEGPSAPSTQPARVGLDGGRVFVCWTTGTIESGRHVMAQSLNAADGSPRGAPVMISPPDADVLGAPS